MAKVRLIAVNPKYRTLPFFCVPVYDEKKRTFKTGQENLSAEELENEPMIIEPDNQYPLRHMMEFDTNNRKDVLLLGLARDQDVIASKSSLVQVGRHLFYLQNVEEEAGERVTKMDLMFEALFKIKENTSIGKQKDVAIYLGIDISQPASVIQDRIYKFCQDNPAQVLEFFTDRSTGRLFAMKLKHYGIIQYRDGKYLDNDILVGRDIDEVVHFTQDHKNEALITKWGLKLERIEGSPSVSKEVEKPVKVKSVSDFSMSDVKGIDNTPNIDSGKIDVKEGQAQGLANSAEKVDDTKKPVVKKPAFKKFPAKGKK